MSQVITIPFSMLPEAERWSVGRNYRIKAVLKQVGMHEDSADFEVVDYTSLEPDERAKRAMLSDGGVLMG